MVRANTMVMPGWETCSVAVDIITLRENSSHLVICLLASPPRLWINSSCNSQGRVLWSRAASSPGAPFYFSRPLRQPRRERSVQAEAGSPFGSPIFWPGRTAVSSISTQPCPTRTTWPWHRRHIRQEAFLFSCSVGCLTCASCWLNVGFLFGVTQCPFKLGIRPSGVFLQLMRALYSCFTERKRSYGESPQGAQETGCQGGIEPCSAVLQLLS